MKKNAFLTFILFNLFYHGAFACDVCKKNQPKGFENITHGTGPQGNMDYIIITVSIIIVVATLGLSLKYLLKPKEDNTDHIKNIIRNDIF